MRRPGFAGSATFVNSDEALRRGRRDGEVVESVGVEVAGRRGARARRARCAAPALRRCAARCSRTPSRESLPGVSSSAPPPRRRRVARANTSPAKLPRPVSVIVVDAPPASGPSVHDRRFWSPDGVTRAARRRRRVETERHVAARTVASSDAPGASTCGARFVTVIVQVVGASSVTGFGEALMVTPRSTRPAGSTTSRNWPGTVVVGVRNREAHGVGADAGADLRRAGQAPGGAQSEAGAALRPSPRKSASAGGRVGVRDERGEIEIERRALRRRLLGDRSRSTARLSTPVTVI